MEKKMPPDAIAYYSAPGSARDSSITVGIGIGYANTVAKEFCASFEQTTLPYSKTAVVSGPQHLEYTYEPDAQRYYSDTRTGKKNHTLFSVMRELLGDEEAAVVLEAAAAGLMEKNPVLGTALAYMANNTLPAQNRFDLTPEQTEIMESHPEAIRIPGKAGRHANTLFPSPQRTAVYEAGTQTADASATNNKSSSAGRGAAVMDTLAGRAAGQKYGPNG